MRIDKNLNLIIPIDRADGAKVYLHSMPLHKAVFERYFMTLSKTFAAIYGEGLGLVAGPRVAHLLLKRMAIEAGEWEGPEGVENGLLGEMMRLTNVIVPGPNGWAPVPLADAAQAGQIDPDDASEVQAALTFFMVASAMHKRQELPAIMAFVGKTWGVRTSSLTTTDFAASLTTSTTDDDTGPKEPLSSIPS